MDDHDTEPAMPPNSPEWACRLYDIMLKVLHKVDGQEQRIVRLEAMARLQETAPPPPGE